jgi:hypothetical protein
VCLCCMLWFHWKSGSLLLHMVASFHLVRETESQSQTVTIVDDNPKTHAPRVRLAQHRSAASVVSLSSASFSIQELVQRLSRPVQPSPATEEDHLGTSSSAETTVTATLANTFQESFASVDGIGWDIDRMSSNHDESSPTSVMGLAHSEGTQNRHKTLTTIRTLDRRLFALDDC